MNSLLAIAVGGAIGALLRFGISASAETFGATRFPLGTLVANLTGCLAIGIIWQISESAQWSPSLRSFVITGLLGALTTFSTFGLETIRLLDDGHFGTAFAYVVVSNAAGLGLAWAGYSGTSLIR